MSWYGKHTGRSKQEIKQLLPPAACKECVYWFRLMLGSSPDAWHQEYKHCPRCGIHKWDILRKFDVTKKVERPWWAQWFQYIACQTHSPPDSN